LAANTLLFVMLGGMLPFVLKRFKLDPALVFSPLPTTVTDMRGFFFVLSLVAAVLPELEGLWYHRSGASSIYRALSVT
jgi:magnesium transporter